MTPLLLALSLSLHASDKPAVSVLYFENRTGKADYDVLRKGLAEMMVTDLVAWDGVTVVERGRLEEVLAELKLQKSKAFDKSTAVKVGKLVGAEYAITGTLALGGDKLRVDAIVTSISKGEVVASASATDSPDKIFDIEQQLVDSLTAAIDVKLKNKDARKKAKVPNLDALLAYSKAIDLSDQGKLDEAQKAMAAVVSKSPTFLMAREKKAAMLELLKDFELKRKDLISASALTAGQRADEELKPKFISLKGDAQRRYLVFREVKGRFLARLLKQSLSSRDSLRVVKPGQEGKALEVMRAWSENQKSFIEEARAYANTSLDARDDELALFKDSGLMGGDSFSADPERLEDTHRRFIIEGRLTDGESFNVAPPLGVMDPKEQEATLNALEKAANRAETEWQRNKQKNESTLEDALMDRAEVLDYLRQDDAAAAAYQKVLDLLPTSRRAKTAEEKIQVIIGAKYEHGREQREKFEKSLKDCDDFYVNFEAGYRLRRKGLAGLDELAAEMERACLGWPSTAMQFSRFYDGLASDAARHDDCARAKRYYLKSFTFGSDGPRSFDGDKGAPWCNFAFSEATFLSKVKIVENGNNHDATAEAAANGLADLISEELGARAIAVDTGGSSHGGVLNMWVQIEEKGKELSLIGRLSLEDNQTVELRVPAKNGAFDLNAFFAPALKVLKAGSETGPRKANPLLSIEAAAAYGSALQLFEDRKYKDAKVAFDAAAKKYPQLRLAPIRATMSQYKTKD